MNEPVMEEDKWGAKRWCLNGILHREDGPAYISMSDGPNIWYLYGRRHREDGPAVEWPSGSKEWYLNNKLHREDGPAKTWPDGYKEWYLNGVGLEEDQYIILRRKQVFLISTLGLK